MTAGVRLKPGEIGAVRRAGTYGHKATAVMQDGTRVSVVGETPVEVESAAKWLTSNHGLRFAVDKYEPISATGNAPTYHWNIRKCEIVDDTIIPTHNQRKRAAQNPIQAPWSADRTQVGGDGHESVSEASTPSCDPLVDLLDTADDLFRDLEALGSGCARLAGELVDVIEAELVAA